MSSDNSDPVVENPTYLGNIRYFFEAEDIDHMQQKGIDLGTYDGVKAHAVQIYSAVTPPAAMPPEASRQWSANRCQTLLNWISNKYPMGSPAIESANAMAAFAAPDRIRKNAGSLSSDEITLLAKAFAGIMAKAVDDQQGYFYLAGLHGLPGGYCQHHNDPFNPWHRIYLKQFEDALRAIPGCGEVTLPYWDIAEPIPDFLWQAPFAAYVFPQAVGSQAAGSSTVRNPQAQIDKLLTQFDFFGDYDQALTQTRWGKYLYDPNAGKVGYGYQQWSIQAHDGGHVASGPTMAQQNYSAYDPIFWFYHCNLDRHWLSWQAALHALDWTSFQSLLDSTLFWKAPLNVVAPFTTTTDQTIAFDIGYDELIAPTAPLRSTANKTSVAGAFAIADDTIVNVAIEGIERLRIPGSFVVNLMADGERVASRAFFQPESPPTCKTCVTIPLVGLQLRIERSQISGKRLTVELEVPGQQEIGAKFPLSQAGELMVRVSVPIAGE
jgi:hypothetical protein